MTYSDSMADSEGDDLPSTIDIDGRVYVDMCIRNCLNALNDPSIDIGTQKYILNVLNLEALVLAGNFGIKEETFKARVNEKLKTLKNPSNLTIMQVKFDILMSCILSTTTKEEPLRV